MKIAINTSAISYNDDVDFSVFEGLGEVKYFGEIPREELFALCADRDALIVNKVEVDEALLAACPDLKYVGTFATGYNVVDIEACRRRGVTVCNAPDYSTHSVSQLVFALLLNFYGKIAEYTSSVAAGDWTRSKTFCYFPYPTYELHGKTFGVFGYGNIGKSVAQIAAAFGANVVVSTRTPPKDCPYESVSFEELLKRSDIVSLHCPLNEKTAKLIDGKALSLMKKNAVLINTARGGLVDEAALAKALNEGRIAGACLDTVAVEPMLADNPLLGAKNCLITPHIGWTPRETRQRLLGIVAGNLKAYIDGKPRNVVSK
ncbi:MAG: D-2-hydroxyacid dehydrogenase [Clostridia bacterium]|nr:D-2-hydroxyacid dehydrogenase [Clostridia bacterium]